jgi:hypothetical protein
MGGTSQLLRHRPAALTAVALTGVAAEQYGQLQFRLLESCAVLRSRWPVVAIWQGHQPGHALRSIWMPAAKPCWCSAMPVVSGLRYSVRAWLRCCTPCNRANTGPGCRTSLAGRGGFDLQAALLRLFADGLISHFHL